MPARNDITGDLIKTGANSRQYQENIAKIFPEKKVTAGRWRTDKETGKSIPIDEWYQKYGQKKYAQAPYVIGDIDPYISPTSEKLITSRRAHRDDLKRTGSRVYEGREQEVKYAEKARKEADAKFEKTIEQGMEKTYYQLRDGLIKPETKIKSSWTIGED